MTDTMTAPVTEGATGAPADSIEGAGKAFLEGLTPEERNTPFTGLDDINDAEGGEPSTPAKDTPTTASEVESDAIVRETDGAEWNEDAQRWTLAGKFVAGDAPAGWSPASDVATDAEANASSDAGVKVVLPGLSERGEEDIEVEVDPDLAQRIQRLKNEGLRGKDYQARKAHVEQREAALEAFTQEMDVDPIGFTLKRMPVEQQLEVGRALLIEHLEALWPDIERLHDPQNRLTDTRALRDRMSKSAEQMQTARAVSVAVKQVIAATEALVPDGVDDETSAEFVADARRDLARAAESGQVVNPQTVPALLARRLARYGFDKPRPKPAAAAVPAVPSARPVSDKARDIAARRPGVAATSADAQSRIRRTQLARAAGQRVAPAGAGAAPTQLPALPPEADADIESMSKALRKKGLPAGWGVGLE